MIERETNVVLASDEERERERNAESQAGPAGTAMQPEPRQEEETRAELIAANEAQDLRSRWEKIQASFVDEPRRAVKEADALVADTIKKLSETFTQEKNKMEQEWDRGDNVSTENLRMALRRYRSFFTRLLEV